MNHLITFVFFQISVLSGKQQNEQKIEETKTCNLYVAKGLPQQNLED